MDQNVVCRRCAPERHIVKEAKVKYNNPDRKRVAEWLKEYDNGLYSNLPSMYTQEELKNMYRLKGAGRKVKDEVLEQRLVEYYNTLREELYPITTELLGYFILENKRRAKHRSLFAPYYYFGTI